MPNNWKTYKLEKIAGFSYGKMPKKELLGKGIYPTFSGYKYQYKYPEFNCDKKDIIIVARGVGGTGDVKIVKEKCYLTNLSIKIELDKGIVDYRYFYFQYFLNTLRYLDSGSAQSQITINDLNRLEIVLPPLQEQQSIASVLSAIDDKIENNLAINKTLEEMAMALYKHWFVDFGPFKDGEFVESELGLIPKGWEVKRLSGIYINHNKKRKPISTNERAKIQGEFPYYGATKILDYINYFNFEGEYILLAEDGTVKTERDTPFLQFVTGKFCVSNHAHVITGSKEYSNEFLYLSLSNTNVIPIITGAVQLKINKENLEKLQFIVPPQETLKDIEDKIIPLYKKIKENKLENQTLTQLRDTLLPKLISGEVRLKEFREN